MKIHHIGYLVKKFEKAQLQFEKLGYIIVSGPSYDADRDIDVVFLEKDGYVVELISPKSEKSAVANLIKVYKNSPYHICYQTDSFNEELRQLEMNGFMKIGAPCPASALGNGRVCFLHSASIGMIELLEEGIEEGCH